MVRISGKNPSQINSGGSWNAVHEFPVCQRQII
jgi:hypothetical protein